MKTVYDVLIEEVNDAIERAQVVIEQGAPKDYADYRYHVGVLRGLRHMQQYIIDLKQKQEHDDE